MKYLCLIYSEEKKRGSMSNEEAEALMREYFTFTDSIRETGHYLGGEGLQSVQTAKTVRIRGNRGANYCGPQ